ncbi:hypothetical protein [Enhygromyxa salina]|uniref:hypothetical protein n=1 Tax=Enhygromyxa salina TaxID=215803 RepID=UPI0011BA4ED0|nr:hypothetical protein [Enhygromyxa salina]
MNDDPNNARLVSPGPVGPTLFPLQKREWDRVKTIVLVWNLAVFLFVLWLDLRPLIAALVAAGLMLLLNVVIEATLRRWARAGKIASDDPPENPEKD